MPSSRGYTYALGPGRITPVVKWLIIANVAMYVATVLTGRLLEPLSLVPQDVVEPLTDARGEVLPAASNASTSS
jgi:hypothetical protein